MTLGGPGRTGRLLPGEFPVEPRVLLTVPGRVPTLPSGVVAVALTAFVDGAFPVFVELAAEDEFTGLVLGDIAATLCGNAPIWKVVGVPYRTVGPLAGSPAKPPAGLEPVPDEVAPEEAP